jgi:hypothetical protein
VLGRLNSLRDLRGGDRCLSRDSVGGRGRNRSGRSSGGAGDDEKRWEETGEEEFEGGFVRVQHLRLLISRSMECRAKCW